jgi:hypothetical protein
LDVSEATIVVANEANPSVARLLICAVESSGA